MDINNKNVSSIQFGARVMFINKKHQTNSINKTFSSSSSISSANNKCTVVPPFVAKRIKNFIIKIFKLEKQVKLPS